IESQLIFMTGSSKLEDYVWDKDTGVLLNGNCLDYKIQTILDVPDLDPIIIESRMGDGCYKSTGVYHSMFDNGLVQCAVQNAIGKWIEDVPITPDIVLKALGKI
ncbi:MAG: hypothetical protein FWG03_09325, partial [Clostridiales bacterium]|nr:hypothetical protein [Clostridiales bacterium]